MAISPHASAMSQAADRIRWTTSDLELLPESSNRYEIIVAQFCLPSVPLICLNCLSKN